MSSIFLRAALRRWALAVVLGLAPVASFACACGCGVFDVGTASMYPQHSGAMAFLEYDFMDQNRNWSGTSPAPAADNPDKRIRTDFFTAGLQYQLNRSWGVEIEVPYWSRYFKTTDDSGNLVDPSHAALGDVRIKGVYTGFSADMSTGMTLGIKFPNGDSSYANFDPDTEIGTGSTDALLGIYHLGNLSADAQWRYFAQAQWDAPLHHKAQYRPGAEVDAAAGAYYEGWAVLPVVKIAPVLSLNATYRGHDGGPLGDPGDSGYTRLLVTPGVEADFAKLSVYVDVGFPVIRNSSGNQLVSDEFWRMNLSYHL
jgi:hypothetical protein